MKEDKKQGIWVFVDPIQCHEEYIKRTSENVERDLQAFRRYVRLCKSFRRGRHDERKERK